MPERSAHPARYAESLPDGRVRCLLCPHGCVIADGESGRCGARRNEGGALVASSYGLCLSAVMDPIEKKPLWHFHPGASVLSVGSWGCNLSCRYCQNHELSTARSGGRYISPEELCEAAAAERGNLGVAFTYNEPLIGFEWVYDCARLLRRRGLKVVLVTNGYLNPEPLRELLPLVDAANVDLKSFSDGFYRDLCGGRVEPVKEALKLFHAACHLEVTKLLVMGHEDPVSDAERIAAWIAETLDPDVPLHLSRYFPRHEWSAPATPQRVMEAAVAAAREHLRFVYAGNASVRGGDDTVCPSCGGTLVSRMGYHVRLRGVSGGRCTACGAEVPLEGV